MLSWPLREWILLALLAGFVLSGLGGCAVSQSGAVYTPWGVWLPADKETVDGKRHQ
jgi:hypothetical protein